jgi:predicted transcriptional regulator
MEAALEEIEFLARSSNRVDVLRLLAADTHTRRSLAEATGASQATLGRILEDFTDRSWVRRDGSHYAATATGRLVADGVADLLSILETEAKLRDVVTYLPTDAMGFDLRRLADATVTVPSRTRPSAPLQRVLDAMDDAERLCAFSHTLNEQSLSVAKRRVKADEQTFEAVLSESAIVALAADARLWAELTALADEGGRIRVREDDVPLSVTVADGTVYLLVRDDGGILQASLHTDDEAVRSWATETFERYWRTATPFDPEAFEG